MSEKVFYSLLKRLLWAIIMFFIIFKIPDTLKPYLALVMVIPLTYFGWRNLKKAEGEERIRRCSVEFSLTIVFSAIIILSFIF